MTRNTQNMNHNDKPLTVNTLPKHKIIQGFLRCNLRHIASLFASYYLLVCVILHRDLRQMMTSLIVTDQLIRHQSLPLSCKKTHQLTKKARTESNFSRRIRIPVVKNSSRQNRDCTDECGDNHVFRSYLRCVELLMNGGMIHQKESKKLPTLSLNL